MKIALHRILTLSLSLVLAFACCPVAQAHDGESSSGHHDGELHGFMLAPTAAAPAGAVGFVAIHTGGDHPGLAVATHGLAVGTYTVNSTSSADGSVTALGTFDVIDFHWGDDFGDGDDGPGGFGVALLPFPAGFNPADIASIQVADAAGATLLSGDNVPPGDFPGGNDHEHEHFVLAPTADAPAGAHGNAEIEAECDNDSATTAPVLKIKTEGLDVGTYTVSVTSLTDGTATVLGTFDVAVKTGFESESEGEGGDEGDAEETKATLPFPVDFDVTNVASVLVANADGVVLLQGDGSVRGGGIEGTEHLREEVALVPTLDAPAGAGGRAKIKAENEDGVVTAFLKIKTFGLEAGTYTASVTSLADGSVTVLGTFNVQPTIEDGDDGDDQGDDDDQGDEDNHDGNHEDGDHWNGDCHFGDHGGIPFPAGFNPLDVATVQIADANGVVLLTGDFSNVTASANTNFIARVRITPGPAAPHARGVAAAAAKVHKHALKQAFKLHAKGVTPKTKFTLKVNGVAVGSVRSDAAGHVAVGRLPRGAKVHRIASVALENAAGQRVLSAHF